MSTVPMTSARRSEILADEYEDVIVVVYCNMSGIEGGFSGPGAEATADDYIRYVQDKYPAYRTQVFGKIVLGKVADAPAGTPNWEVIEEPPTTSGESTERED